MVFLIFLIEYCLHAKFHAFSIWPRPDKTPSRTCFKSALYDLKWPTPDYTDFDNNYNGNY